MEHGAANVKNGRERIEAAELEGHEVIIGNQELPTAEYLHDIAESVRDNVFTILIGETGSGKTTQTPQILFANGLSVDHTQPRRSAAHEAAKRIGEELASSVPGLPEHTVAVHTGEESTVTPSTQVTIYTDGMLLAKDYNPTRNILDEPKRGNVTIVDEVHEWNKNIEVLIGLLMQEAKTNPDLRVVFMTATLDKDFLVRRLHEVTGIDAHCIEIPGRTYPIEYVERPDMTSVGMTLEIIKPGAGILVFKQGIGEIKDTIHEITKGLPRELKDKVRIFPYHSSYSTRKLSEACNFEQSPDEVKIVVGTNAMESSLTIKGIQYGVDDGLARQVWTDKRGYEGLYSMPISQSRCKQRAGRAGRICPGHVYLVRADSETPFVPFADRPEHELAEIQRLDLKKEVLRLASIGIDLEALPTVNPVEQLKIIRAKESLAILGALDADGMVTEIGVEMNRFPVRTTLMRTIVESARYDEETQRLVAAMAAAADAGGLPFYGRFMSNDWKELTQETSSDLIAQLDLFIATRTMTPRDQHGIGINPKNVGKARETYEKILYQLGIDDAELAFPNELQREEIARCIYAGHVEYIFERMGRTTFRLLQDSEPTTYKLSDRSVVDPRSPRLVVGVPYIIERMRHGKKETVPIIEAVTDIPFIGVLGDAAVNLARWSDEEIKWRGGRAFMHSEQSIRGMRTGVTSEVMSDETDVARRSRELITYALEHPGPAQLELRAIKKELEELNHLAREGVTRLTQDGLLEFLQLAVSSLNVLDAHYLDSELRLMMQEHNISLATYISPEDAARVRRDAPPEITVLGTQFAVDYRNGYPKIKHWDPTQIAAMSGNVCLPDGRTVRFVHEKREYTLEDLKLQLAAR